MGEDREMDTNDDDRDLGELLRAAGRREPPPPGVAAHVRAAVAAEWRDAVAVRARRRRRITTFAMAASVAAVAVGAWLLRPGSLPATSIATVATAAPVVTVARLDGTMELQVPGGAWRTVAALDQAPAGATLRTGRTGRAVLAWQGGATVRVDADTRLALADGRVVLEAGAVYVDGDTAAGHVAPDVATPLGLVRHLGTRYEVRVVPERLRVTVRDGRVEVASGGTREVAAGGERLIVASTGAVARERVPTWGAEWSWLDALAPALQIEGRRVDEFVASAARETGREVRYASPAARAAAGEVVLRGSIAGLAPDVALQAVLATTRLEARAQGAEIVVAIRDDTAGGLR
jgi:ferric-dicitrate binding protein FerR (iron transport regulator)